MSFIQILSRPKNAFAIEAENVENNNWKKACTETGEEYFYNNAGESQWAYPTGNGKFIPSWDVNWDKQPVSKVGVVHQIVLIRHGQYADVSLNDLGREQALITANRLKILLQSRDIAPIKKYFYSTVPRAQETSDIILTQLSDQSLKPEPCTMLREGAVARPDPPTNPKWQPTDAKFEMDGARVEAAFKTYFSRPPERAESSFTTVLVCHGNVIRYLVARALQFPPETWTRLRVFNASITILEIRHDGVVILRALGDTGHFDGSMITDNHKIHKFIPK